MLALLGPAREGRAATISTLVSFDGSNGQSPGALITDSTGDLFGTTAGGGSSGQGTVFEISRSNGVSTSFTSLASFGGPSGSGVQNGLVADNAGNLFGSYSYGVYGDGLVFEMARTAGGYSAPTTIATFSGGDGSVKEAGLIANRLVIDADGNLFGATYAGGAPGYGTVFEIAKSGAGYGSTITLATLDGSAGAYAYGGLIMDAAGNLFGTTTGGAGGGSVYEVPKSNGTYGPIVTLAVLNGSDGAVPYSGLVLDAAGNLFGTTTLGGTANKGTVFEIAKSGSTYGDLTTIADFLGANGANPNSPVIVDAMGNLFGTTRNGGASDVGAVYEIPNSGGVYGDLTVMASFDGSNGALPYSALVADADGNLFGTTIEGGGSNGGTVFEIVNPNGAAGTTDVPEPGSLILLGAGLVGFSALGKGRLGRS